MKSCAVGLSVRFFNVMTAIGMRVWGSTTRELRSEDALRGSGALNRGRVRLGVAVADVFDLDAAISDLLKF